MQILWKWLAEAKWKMTYVLEYEWCTRTHKKISVEDICKYINLFHIKIDYIFWGYKIE